jgi:crotonobetainyl-CoA:carnitine CoA-transferase CaiB-like acyl-CoA transferase
MTLPLNGIRVLDVTNVLAGPFCSYQLTLLGAEVIKIEQPGTGDLARRLGADSAASANLMGATFVGVNAGKQSVTINLKSPEGKEVFKKLAAISHAVVENFRPGVMKRLGLDHAVLSEINPAIVYCAISGFGQDGDLSMRPAYDQIIQGMSGVMSITGDEHNAPLRAGYPVCDTVGGITAALSICAALVDAQVNGKGRMIDVSMLEATLGSMGWIVSNYLLAGTVPVPMGNDNFTAAPSGAFPTREGLLNIAPNENSQFHSLCDVIGRPELKTDPRFADREERRRNRLAINREIERELQKRTAAEWDQLLIAAGVPSGQVLSVPEILEHRHLAQRHFISTLSNTETKQKVTRGGFRFEGSDTVPATPAPKLSEHTEVWLKKLGYPDQTIADLRSAGVI